MITKGLHFPSCSLVGVISIDGQLQIPDFRASEYVFQLVTQVAGRAGRSTIKGEVILQTFIPDNPTLKLSTTQDYVAFYNEEIEARKLFSYPPFSKMGKLTFSGKDEQYTYSHANKIRNHLLSSLPSNYQFSPLNPCGYARVKNQFRFQFFIKGEKSTLLSNAIQKTIKDLPDSKVMVLVDIDPLYTFF